MADLIWSIGGFVAAIGVLVAFHEFGHYWVARRCGVKVLRYSLGFGRPIWRRIGKDGVEWVVSAIPLGGYVKMLDEREGEVPSEDRHRAFNRQALWKRAAIVAAGPFFNFALAVVAYWAVYVVGVADIKPVIAQPPAASAAALAGLREGDVVLRIDGHPITTWQELRTELIEDALGGDFVQLDVESRDGAIRTVSLSFDQVRVDPQFLFSDLGVQTYSPPLAPVLDEPVAGEAAAAAGFRHGDRIVSANGESIETWRQWVEWVRARPGESVELRFEREGRLQSVVMTLGSMESAGERIGRFGAGPSVSPEDKKQAERVWRELRAERRLGIVAALPAAAVQTWQMSSLTVHMLYRMALGDVSIKNVSGPIQIAQYAGYTAQAGIVSFLMFMAVVSVSLGVLNLLPVPMLDGGHLLFYAVEAVKGSPVSERAQLVGQQVGLTFLALLMGLAFYNDIMRLIG